MAFWLNDSERSPFGLGWEMRRRNEAIDANPFAVASKEFAQFRDGWNQYMASKTAEYANEAVNGPLPRKKAKRRRAG